MCLLIAKTKLEIKHKFKDQFITNIGLLIQNKKKRFKKDNKEIIQKTWNLNRLYKKQIGK